MEKKNELIAKENGYVAQTTNMQTAFSEEMDCMTPSFEKVKIPSGGGLAYEVPGEDPDSPDMVKEFSGVIVYHHPMNVYYKESLTVAVTRPIAVLWTESVESTEKREKSKNVLSVISASLERRRMARVRRASKKDESTYLEKARTFRYFYHFLRAV